MIDEIKNILKASLPDELIDSLLDSYLKLKEEYYLGNHRSASLEAGHFSEIGLRIIQNEIEGRYTSLDDKLPNFHDELIRFGNTGGHSDTIRFHIPRTLEVIHDIRNKRDVGHPRGELDANYSDATLSFYSASWVLVELLRVYHTGDINKAQRLVNDIIRFQIPIIQDIDGFLKILDPSMHLWRKILIWSLYKRGDGITINEIERWTKGRVQRYYINRVLDELEYDKGYLHSEEGRYYITHTGVLEVARNIPLSIRA